MKPSKATQPSSLPTRKVTAGAAGGAPLAILIQWGLGEMGIQMPIEVAIAMTSVLGVLVAYFVKDVNNIPDSDHVRK